MDSGSRIDMSLDEIIKINRKNRAKATGSSAVKSTRGRRLSSLRQGFQKTSTLKPKLGPRMKSRQASTALAIFRRARQTAVAAARVAADASAFLSANNQKPRKPQFPARDLRVTRINRGRMLQSGSRNGVAINRIQNPQRYQQNYLRAAALNNAIGFQSYRNDRPSPGLQMRQTNVTNRPNQRGNRRQNQIQRQRGFDNRLQTVDRQSVQVPRRLTNQQFTAFNNRLRYDNTQARRNQEYLAQARALIRAQQEMNRQPIYVESSRRPARKNRGRFRR